MEIKPYKTEDLEFILANFVMREADRLEVTAQSGLEPLEVTRMALSESTLAWVGYDGDKPIGVGGLVLTDEGFGVPWLLRSDDAFNKRLFEANGVVMGALDLFLTKTHYLTNFVAEDNKDTIRWLKFIGFTVTDDRYILNDPDKVFLHFYLHKEVS